jgi:ABC-type transport system involved in multi-copper enzyme maturation permease subunit
MRFHNSIIRLGIVSFVFVLGITVAILSISQTIANSKSHNLSKYSVNKNGQTYGSSLYATSPSEEPDLIKAYGVDGTLGYVKKTDLYGDMPKTPEEAIARQQRNKVLGSTRTIPLYDETGEKVIGVFELQQGESTEVNK